MLDRTDDTTAAEFGPAMLALPSAKWQNFVVAFVLYGLDAANAVQAAGFCKAGSTPETRAKQAWRLTSDARVQAAILELGKQHLHVLVPRALQTYEKAMTDPHVKGADRLRAADAIMLRVYGNTTNVHMQVEHTHHHQIDHTAAALEALRYFKSLGVPRSTLVEQFGESGLGRYERMIELEDQNSANHALIDVTPPPPGSVEPMRSAMPQ
jgi:hypothetical protein